jgi:predicted dithiol-disulfide oxidoreductase (DUF899 family)
VGELRYPNESKDYRAARDALLKDEQELVARTRRWPRSAAGCRRAAR